MNAWHNRYLSVARRARDTVCARGAVAAALLLTLTPAHAAQWLRGAIHVHSSRSFDSQGTFEEISKAAKKTGLDFIVLSDHVPIKADDIWVTAPDDDPDLVWIDGVEVEVDEKYHFLAIGHAATIVDWQKGKELDGLRAAKREGALIFLDHLEDARGFSDLDLIDGIELYNTHADLFTPAIKLPSLVFWSMKKNSKKLWLGILDPPKRQLAYWQKWSTDKDLKIVGGNDAHQNVRLWGKQIDPYEESFKFVNTFVKAAAKDRRSIMTALRSGPSYVAFPILAPADGFEMTLHEESPTYIKIVLPPQSSGKIRLIHDNVRIKEHEGDHLIYPQPKPGLYRAEVWLKHKKDWNPWIYSAALRVGEKDAQ
ncbi:MAG: PHP domain-containing protein [Elusimicrobiota bacterium]